MFSGQPRHPRTGTAPCTTAMQHTVVWRTAARPWRSQFLTPTVCNVFTTFCLWSIAVLTSLLFRQFLTWAQYRSFKPSKSPRSPKALATEFGLAHFVGQCPQPELSWNLYTWLHETLDNTCSVTNCSLTCMIRSSIHLILLLKLGSTCSVFSEGKTENIVTWVSTVTDVVLRRQWTSARHGWGARTKSVQRR